MLGVRAGLEWVLGLDLDLDLDDLGWRRRRGRRGGGLWLCMP